MAAAPSVVPDNTSGRMRQPQAPQLMSRARSARLLELQKNEPKGLRRWDRVQNCTALRSASPTPYRGTLKLAAGERRLEVVGRLLGIAPMRSDLQDALIDLERLSPFLTRFEDHPHAHERPEVLGFALERLRDVGHGALIVVVEVTRGGAGIPALRPVRLERNRRVEDFERVGIVLDADRLARPLK